MGENGRALQSIRGRLKDLDGMRVAEQELGLSFDYLEHAARMGMAALMLASACVLALLGVCKLHESCTHTCMLVSGIRRPACACRQICGGEYLRLICAYCTPV